MFGLLYLGWPERESARRLLRVCFIDIASETLARVKHANRPLHTDALEMWVRAKQPHANALRLISRIGIGSYREWMRMQRGGKSRLLWRAIVGIRAIVGAWLSCLASDLLQ